MVGGVCIYINVFSLNPFCCRLATSGRLDCAGGDCDAVQGTRDHGDWSMRCLRDFRGTEGKWQLVIFVYAFFVNKT